MDDDLSRVYRVFPCPNCGFQMAVRLLTNKEDEWEHVCGKGMRFMRKEENSGDGK